MNDKAKSSNKRRLTTPELVQQLREQMHLLQGYCTQFDSGDWIAAKPMATALRVLLHHPDKPKAGQGSLLAQLGLRGGFWLDTTRASGLPRHGRFDWPTLIGVLMGNGSVGFQPLILHPNIPCRKTGFIQWWGASLIDHIEYGPISRKKLICGMADQDGGAHVDGFVDSSYDAFSRGAYFKARFGESQELARGAVHACIRTIAHETILTVRKYGKAGITAPYRWSPTGSQDIFTTP